MMEKKEKIIDFVKYQSKVHKIGFFISMFFLISAFVALGFSELSINELQRISNLAYAALFLALFNMIFMVLYIDKKTSIQD